ncbi:hypothetical protein ASA1KI_26440 [Opitutales bacterium ASA1]|uniref:ubiquinol-cytochrome c reductase iron-sulfur subunit n=1 Tax=Congregicoccus parvus TaxID=3081749 RepID=UPI002B29306A|nr:hypothetical protein ASA1KI_26440 [Opitutales bacterium ASA1]
MERRDFLATAVITGGTVATAAVLGPVAWTALSPAWSDRRRGVWADVGTLEEFEIGKVTHAVVEVPRDDWAASLRRRGVFVWRQSEGNVTVFARSCTDLGCPVTWDPGNGWFFCPCHGGIFDRDGEPQRGPPKRPLHRYAHRVEAGRLMIDLDSIPPQAG